MIRAVISYHLNPYTCGVARFNRSLAEAMQLPLVGLEEYLNVPYNRRVLLSIKIEEIGPGCQLKLATLLEENSLDYDLFLHSFGGTGLEDLICARANRVYAASSEIGTWLTSIRPDVVSLFAPGAPVISEPSDVDLTFLTFGMAHKIRSEGYQQLSRILEGDSRTFRLEISTAIHEGGSFDESFFTVGDEISAAFSGNVSFLGFLADSAVSNRLRRADALVAFFPRGARENNTTVLGAMAHGCPVISNLDDRSPEWMKHGETMFDVFKLSTIPSVEKLRAVGSAGREACRHFDFSSLSQILLR